MCTVNSVVLAEQTNSANITVFTVHVFVAVILRLYQEDYTKREWKKDRKEMEVTLSQKDDWLL